MVRVMRACVDDVRMLVVAVVMITFAFGALGVGLTATSVFAGHDDPDVVHACFAPWGKILRYADDPADCAGYENFVDLAAAGAAGPVSGWERASTVINILTGTNGSSFVDCAAGKKLLGGGVTTNSIGPGTATVEMSGPLSDTRWTATVHNSTGLTITVTISAICGYVSP